MGSRLETAPAGNGSAAGVVRCTHALNVPLTLFYTFLHFSFYFLHKKMKKIKKGVVLRFLNFDQTQWPGLPAPARELQAVSDFGLRISDLTVIRVSISVYQRFNSNSPAFRFRVFSMFRGSFLILHF